MDESRGMSAPERAPATVHRRAVVAAGAAAAWSAPAVLRTSRASAQGSPPPAPPPPPPPPVRTGLFGVSFGDDLFSEVDPATGAWTSIGSLGIDFPFGLEWHPDLGVMFATDGNGGGFGRVDLSTGAFTLINNPGLNLRDLGYANGVLYGVDFPQGFTYVVDPATGIYTPIGSTTIRDATGMAWDSANGVMYGLDATNNMLCTVDLNSGAWSAFGATTNTVSPSGLAYDSVNDVLYGCDFNNSMTSVVNRMTGEFTPIGTHGRSAAFALGFIPPA